MVCTITLFKYFQILEKKYSNASEMMPLKNYRKYLTQW